jgi:hypothetical protein
MELKLDLARTLCGFSVPLSDYQGERASIKVRHKDKGPNGI